MLERAERHHGREEGCRHEAPTDLLAQHGDFDGSEAEAALVLGYFNGKPPLVRHGRPRIGVVPARRVGGRRWRGPVRFAVRAAGRTAVRAAGRAAPRTTGSGQRTDDRTGPHTRPQCIVSRHALEECGGGLTQGLLIGREVEVHGGAFYGHP